MALNFSASRAVFWWQPRAWLRAEGEDAASFLQGQFTNDLRNSDERGVYGLWLNQKGKVVADSFVLRGAERGAWGIGSYFSAGETIRERLEAYVIADDVTLIDETSGWRGVTLGGRTEEWGEVSERLRGAGAWALRARRGAGEWSEWAFPAGMQADVEAWCADAEVLTEQQMERLRIEAGIPAIPRDVGATDLPNEAGLEKVAISYTKGCYLGQEVMARLKAMGQVRRRVRRVHGDGPVPVAPTPLWQGERAVGELRSVAATESGFVGLGMCALLHLREGEPVQIGGAGGANAMVDGDAAE
ncbi:folate-binding protein [Horticoccus luteus]|uniref:Folate-binding protein n=1 Tax=Horticoccus luteus TaxID=2862869 RepID=A0A8F9TUK3_9BACT|nr:folate-binding protein [Horticoccus luteus]QYM79366.1 folate-binding protein [Horticoccus luteus]